MRGYPLLQLVLVGLLFAAAGLPVWKLTRPAAAVEAPLPSMQTPPAAPAATTALEVRVSFAPAPADFRLTALGQPVLEGRGPQTDFAAPVKVSLPKEGMDFALEVNWPAPPDAAKPPPHAAARVTFRFPDGHTVERTVWGEAGTPLVELITVMP